MDSTLGVLRHRKKAWQHKLTFTNANNQKIYVMCTNLYIVVKMCGSAPKLDVPSEGLTA